MREHFRHAFPTRRCYKESTSPSQRPLFKSFKHDEFDSTNRCQRRIQSKAFFGHRSSMGQWNTRLGMHEDRINEGETRAEQGTSGNPSGNVPHIDIRKSSLAPTIDLGLAFSAESLARVLGPTATTLGSPSPKTAFPSASLGPAHL